MTYVHNPKSESTPARNLQDPSRGRPLKGRFSGTRLNINQLIRVPNYTLITPLEFGVLQSFLPVLLGADLATAFRAIGHSLRTSLQNLTVFYEGLNGQPLMTPVKRPFAQGIQYALSTLAKYIVIIYTEWKSI